MLGMEGRHQPRPIAFGELALARFEWHLDVPGLVKIAALEGQLEALRLARNAGALEERGASFPQVGEQPVDTGEIEMPIRGVERPSLLPSYVGDQPAIGAEARGETRNHEALDAEDARHVADMAGRGAAAADDIALARIDALIDGDVLDGADHIVIGGRIDRIGRLDAANAKPFGRLVDRGFRLAAVELDAAAKEIVRIDDAKHHIGVGDGRLGAAAAVAGGTRHGADAVRPDPQQSARIDPGDAAATRPHRADIDLRYAQHLHAEGRLGGDDEMAIAQGRHVEGSAPMSTTMTLSALVRLIAAIGASVGPDMTL